MAVEYEIVTSAMTVIGVIIGGKNYSVSAMNPTQQHVSLMKHQRQILLADSRRKR